MRAGLLRCARKISMVRATFARSVSGIPVPSQNAFFPPTGDKFLEMHRAVAATLLVTYATDLLLVCPWFQWSTMPCMVSEYFPAFPRLRGIFHRRAGYIVQVPEVTGGTQNKVSAFM